jgi:hypothetical protein
MDLSKILKGDEKSENVNIHKKSKYVPSISTNPYNPNNYSNKNEIDKLLEEEKNNLHLKPWNKLDNTTKNNLFKNYLSIEKDLNGLDENQTSVLHKLLIKNIKNINKSSDVDYDSENGVLNKIHILIYDEEYKSYSLNFAKKKSKSVTKSKSNLDKYMKS